MHSKLYTQQQRRVDDNLQIQKIYFMHDEFLFFHIPFQIIILLEPEICHFLKLRHFFVCFCFNPWTLIFVFCEQFFFINMLHRRLCKQAFLYSKHSKDGLQEVGTYVSYWPIKLRRISYMSHWPPEIQLINYIGTEKFSIFLGKTFKNPYPGFYGIL